MTGFSSQIQKSARSGYFIQIGLLLFILLFSVLLFTFFHEGGHALVGMLFGARLTSFNIDFLTMDAHVGLDASFTPLQQSIVSLAGFLTPYLLVMILLFSTPRRGNALLEWVKLLPSATTLGSLIAWVVLPWFYLAGMRPADDSITFMMNSGIAPPLVSLGAALILGAGLAVFFWRLEGVKGILARMRTRPAEFTTPAARRTLAVLVIVFAGIAASAYALGAVYGSSRSNFLSTPSGYIQVAEIQLNQKALQEEPVYRFALEQPAGVSLFFAMEGLKHRPGRITLTGPNGYENVFYRDGEKAAGNFTVHPRDLPLPAGSYQVVITFPKDPGTLVISEKIEYP